MKSRKKSRRIDSYNKPKTVKQAMPFPFKRVRIDWIDIITEGGWGTDKEFKSMKLATPVSEGWLFSKDDETVRIFAGYDVTGDFGGGDCIRYCYTHGIRMYCGIVCLNNRVFRNQGA